MFLPYLRGRPRKYGKNKISLANRAGQKRGWQTIDCTVYGKAATKTYKTFLATYAPVGGVIRVVLVKEDHGCYAFFSTDPTASVKVNCFSGNETIGVWIKGRSPRLIMVEWAAVIEGSSLFVGVGPAIA